MSLSLTEMLAATMISGALVVAGVTAAQAKKEAYEKAISDYEARLEEQLEIYDEILEAGE